MLDVKPSRLKQAKSIAIVSSGNFLEMYDFMVFGYYATAISKAFFPGDNDVTKLLLAFLTFGAGFLMRPIGAVILGAYIDKHGRRTGLLLTLGLMALGTLAIAVTPTYSQIGIAAPFIVLAGRLIQGLSAGVELGGVSVYLSEIAPPGKKGFYVSWQSASQQLAVVFAALIGLAANAWLGKEVMAVWGWRIPFIIGCVMIPFLLLIRRLLEESPAFLAQPERPHLHEVVRQLATNWLLVLRGVGMVMMTTVFFYLITAYTPTFGQKELKLTAVEAFLATLCVGVSNFIILPLTGALSDKIGRKPILITAAIAGLACGYPALHWLVADPSFGAFLAVLMLFSVIYGTYNGAMVVFLTEVMPARVRTAAFSLSYSLAAGLLGGFTPFIATALIEKTGDKAIPGLWLCLAAAVGLASVLSFTLGKKNRLKEALA
jgi:MFS family permease